MTGTEKIEAGSYKGRFLMAKIAKKPDISKKLSKDELISKEMQRLLRIYKDVPPEKVQVCRDLVQNAAFIAVSLRDLQQDINKNGWTETYDNGGGQTGRKLSAAAQQYTKLVGTYNQIAKTLIAQLPASERAAARTAVDPMSDFLNSK